MNVHERRNAIFGVEFDRYVMDHPAFAARIPRGAQVVLQLHDDPRFNAWARRVAKRQRAPGQPVVFVTIHQVRPAKSRLVAPKLAIQAA